MLSVHKYEYRWRMWVVELKTCMVWRVEVESRCWWDELFVLVIIMIIITFVPAASAAAAAATLCCCCFVCFSFWFVSFYLISNNDVYITILKKGILSLVYNFHGNISLIFLCFFFLLTVEVKFLLCVISFHYIVMIIIYLYCMYAFFF